MYKGSLNTFTVLASVELTKNIVKAAMSDASYVSFKDIACTDDAVYLPTYIMSRRRININFGHEVVYLGYLDFSKAMNDYYKGDLSDDEFTEICRKARAEHASFCDDIRKKMNEANA